MKILVFPIILLIFSIVSFRATAATNIEKLKDSLSVKMIYTLQDCKNIFELDSLYNHNNFDSAIVLANAMLTNNKALEDNSKIYVQLYFSYLFSKDTINAKKTIDSGLKKGLNEFEGYKLEWFTRFDTDFNNNVKKKFLENSVSNVDSILYNKIDSLSIKDQYWRKMTQVQIDSMTYDFYIAKWKESDSTNLIEIKKIVHEKGWLGFRELGKNGDNLFWSLIQHADSDVKFQIEMLRLLEIELLKHNTSRRNYAYLYDRVCVNLNVPQVFGTQFSDMNFTPEGELVNIVVYPLIDAENVNYYRLAFNLESLEEYINYSKNYFKPIK